MARLPLGAPSPSGLILAHPCPRALPSRGSRASWAASADSAPPAQGPTGRPCCPLGTGWCRREAAPRAGCPLCRCRAVGTGQRAAEGSVGAGGARRQCTWPSSGGVSDRPAKPLEPPDHRLSLHGGFRVQPQARLGQQGQRAPPPSPRPSASLWVPGGGQRWVGGLLAPREYPVPAQALGSGRPRGHSLLGWCCPGTRAAGWPGSQTGWGPILSGTRVGLGVPPPSQGPGVGCGEGTPGPGAELGVHLHPGHAAWTPLSLGAVSSGWPSLCWGRGWLGEGPPGRGAGAGRGRCCTRTPAPSPRQ